LGQQSCGEKQLPGRTRVIVLGGEQYRIANGLFFPSAADHFRSDHWRFKGQSSAPAAEPRLIAADQIVD
jgi:hypothetical protein